MLKLTSKLSILVIFVTVLLFFYFQSLKKPALSEQSDTYSFKQKTTLATATAPPKLVSATLGGKQVYVLYVTQADDTVLVRCYPTYQPTITVRTLGSNPDSKTQKEGVMTCRPSI